MKELDLTRLVPRGAGRTRRRPAGSAHRRAPDTPYESRIRKEASLSDLDLDAAADFLKIPPADVVDALRDLGLIRGADDDIQVTNAGLLLFAGSPARHWHPGAGIRVMRVPGTARIMGHRSSFTRVTYAGPPLARTIDKSFRLAAERIRPSEALRHIFFSDCPEYPSSAWREVLINAIAHRDYEATAETEAIFYDDRLEVSSPGPALAPVALDELRRGEATARSRNPMIVRVLAKAGLVGNEAKGLVRAADEMAQTMLPEPTMESRGGFFTVTLHNEPEFATSGPGWKRLVSRLRLEPDQKRILLARPDGFTVDDYARLNAVSANEAQRRVDDLVELDIVVPVDATGEAPEYFLTQDLDSRRWFLEDRLPRLREHFRDRSGLRNADYRELVGISYPTARKELDLLVEDGFLRMQGRGRALRYLPTMSLRE